MEEVRVVEEVHESVFDVPHCFQIANERECMYMAARSRDKMIQWVETLQQAVQQKGVDMLPLYHYGFYNQKKWTCCEKSNPREAGCTPTSSLFVTHEAGGDAYHKEYLSDTSSSAFSLTRNAMFSESVSSSSTTMSQDACLSCSSEGSTLQSPGASISKAEFSKKEASEEMGSGAECGNNYVSFITVSSGASGSSESSSKSDNIYSVIGKPHLPETYVENKQKGTHRFSKHHQQMQVHKNSSPEPDDTCKNVLQRGRQPNASVWSMLSEQPIIAVVFLSSHVVVYATKDHHVCICNTSERKLLYDVKLTYPVSTLDVWNDYILVGSSPVQLFEMKKDRLRRIVVMDPEDNHQLTVSSSSLASFLPNGSFVTANEIGNEVVFWQLPTEENVIITDAALRHPVKSTLDLEPIHSLWGYGDSKQPLLVIARKKPSQAIAVDVFDCSDFTCIKEVEMSFLKMPEKVYRSFERRGRAYIGKKYGSSVTTIGRSQSLEACIPVALDDGTVVLYENSAAFSTLNSDQEHSKIASIVCMESNGTTLVAAGYENGKLGLWGGEFERKRESDFMKELFTTQVFLGDSFYRESLLHDDYEFTVGFNGGKFENYPSYSLKIPRGAIPKGEEVVIKTGIMKYGPCGPFKCPDNIDIVSPVLWLCSNNPNFQFLKPATLEMQHCCNSPESLVLLKADHNDKNGTHDTFKFQVKNSSHKFTSREYCWTEITHFCFYCLGIRSSDDGSQKGFRLIPVEHIGYMEKKVIFCLSYNLYTCKLAVKKQYPSEEYRIGQALPVEFQGDMGVDIDYPKESSGWMIAKIYPGHPIRLEDLNWQQKFSTQEALFEAHKNGEYPPRFILEICGRNAQKGVTVTVRLTNVAQPVSYDINLYLPSAESEGQVEMSSGLTNDSGFETSLGPIYRSFSGSAPDEDYI